MSATYGQCCRSLPPKIEKLIAYIRPGLVLFIIINKLHRIQINYLATKRAR